MKYCELPETLAIVETLPIYFRPSEKISVNMLMGAFGTGVLVIVLDGWLAMLALSLLGAAIFIPVWPEFKFEIFGVAVVLGMGGTGAAWSQQRRGSSTEKA